MKESIMKNHVVISELFKNKQYFVRLQRLFINDYHDDDEESINNHSRNVTEHFDKQNVFDFFNKHDI